MMKKALGGENLARLGVDPHASRERRRIGEFEIQLSLRRVGLRQAPVRRREEHRHFAIRLRHLADDFRVEDDRAGRAAGGWLQVDNDGDLAGFSGLLNCEDDFSERTGGFVQKGAGADLAQRVEYRSSH